MLSIKRYFKIFFRISIVVALIAAVIDANKVRERHVSEVFKVLELEMKMDCAVGLPEGLLARIRNLYGNYDVAQYCGPGTDGETYIVADYELDQHRAGDFMRRFDYRAFHPIVDWKSNLTVFIFVFLAINLIGACLYLFFLLGKWIFK